jgi:hypothetical protein
MIIPLGSNLYVSSHIVKRIVRVGEEFVVHYMDTRDVDVVRGSDAVALNRFLKRLSEGGGEPQNANALPRRMNEKRRQQ